MKKEWNFVGLLLAVFVAMMVWPVGVSAQEPSQETHTHEEPIDPTDNCPQLFPLDGLSYVFENGTLTYYYGDVKTQGALDLNTWTYNEWFPIRDNVTKIVFDQSMSNYHPTNCAGLFIGCNKLTEIVDFKYLNTENVTDMSRMFDGCSSLTELDLDSLNTSNVTDMSRMFHGCSSFTELDLSSFNTANVTNMDDMFNYCSNIQTIFVGDNWTTAKVTSSGQLFVECKKLVGGKGTACIDDEGQWDPDGRVEDGKPYAHIDGGASNPGYFTNKPNEAYATFDTQNGTLTFYYDCNKPDGAFGMETRGFDVGWLFYSDVREWISVRREITKVVFDQSFADYRPTDCAYWFYRCYNLSEIKGIENLNTENVESMEWMFACCTNLSTLDLSSFNTGSVENMSYMFYCCSGLSNLNLKGFNTKNVKDMSGMFSGCGSLTSLDLSSFDTRNVTDMSCMFYGNNKLAQINLSSFNTAKVIDMSAMFGGGVWEYDSYPEDPDGFYENFDDCGCYALKSLDLSNFDTKNVTDMRWMFEYGGFTNLDLSGFKTDNVTKMEGMFGHCESLATIYVSDNWNNQSVNVSGNMFGSCLKLVGGKGTVFHSGKTDVSYAHIDGGASNPGYFTKYGEPAYVLTSPYATFTDGTLILGYGSNIPNGATKISGEVIQSLSKSTSSNYIASDITAAKNVQKVVFDKTFADYQPENCAYWFNGCNNLTGIDGMENLDTKNTTDMTAMFQNCEKLASLDLSGFNTTKVTYMSKMFNNCTELTTIFVGDTWNMSNVEKSQDMFKNCQKLVGGNGTQYDANNSDEDFAKIDGKNSGYFTKAGQEPYKVAEPYAVFNNGTLTFYYDNKKPNGAYGMKVTYDSEWYSVASDIKKVVFDNSFAEYRPTSCFYWFGECENLTEIIDIRNLNTENVTNMKSMFCYCNNLKTLDLSSFNTKNVTIMSYMLDSCVNLKTVDLSSFNTKNVTNMCGMFSYCYNLATIDLSNFDTKNVTSMESLFYKCTNLKTIDVSSFDTKNVTDMSFMLAYCEKLQNIDLSNFDTKNVTTMYSMFHRCANLLNLDLSGFDTKNVTDMRFMFADCEKLQNIDLDNFDTRNVTNMSSMFQRCSNFQNLDLSSFNTKNVTDMSYMFTKCSSLNTIYVGDDWSTSSVTESKNMFPQCAALVGGKGTTFNSDKIDKTYARIDGGKDNPGYFTKSGEKPYEEPTPVSEITPANYNTDIWSFEKTIYVQNPGKEIRIVDMSGRLVKTVKATADRMEIPMQKSGIYIVKTGAKTQKVMIQ